MIPLALVVQRLVIAGPQESATIPGAAAAASFINDSVAQDFVNRLPESAPRIEEEYEVSMRAGLY